MADACTRCGHTHCGCGAVCCDPARGRGCSCERCPDCGKLGDRVALSFKDLYRIRHDDWPTACKLDPRNDLVNDLVNVIMKNMQSRS